MSAYEYLLNNNLTIGEIISRDYRYAKVFADFGIDFCCTGDKNFNLVIKTLNINKAELIAELRKVDSLSLTEPDYDHLSLPSLMNYIVEKHHKYLREALPYLKNLIEKTTETHAHNHEFLADLNDEYKLFQTTLTQHLNKEEEILFRVIKYISDCMYFKEKPRNRGYKSIKEVIGVYEEEHRNTGVFLRRFQRTHYKLLSSRKRRHNLCFNISKT